MIYVIILNTYIQSIKVHSFLEKKIKTIIYLEIMKLPCISQINPNIRPRSVQERDKCHVPCTICYVPFLGFQLFNEVEFF